MRMYTRIQTRARTHVHIYNIIPTHVSARDLAPAPAARSGCLSPSYPMPLLALARAPKAPSVPAPGGVLAVQSGGADVETWLGKTAAEVGQMLVGCSITKLFPKYGYFKGEVEAFDAQTGMFAVVYDDDDEEMLPLAQLAHCLPKEQEKLAREYLGNKRKRQQRQQLRAGTGDQR
jgi:hypothetical protein